MTDTSPRALGRIMKSLSSDADSRIWAAIEAWAHARAGVACRQAKIIDACLGDARHVITALQAERDEGRRRIAAALAVLEGGVDTFRLEKAGAPVRSSGETRFAAEGDVLKLAASLRAALEGTAP